MMFGSKRQTLHALLSRASDADHGSPGNGADRSQAAQAVGKHGVARCVPWESSVLGSSALLAPGKSSIGLLSAKSPGESAQSRSMLRMVSLAVAATSPLSTTRVPPYPRLLGSGSCGGACLPSGSLRQTHRPTHRYQKQTMMRHGTHTISTTITTTHGRLSGPSKPSLGVSCSWSRPDRSAGGGGAGRYADSPGFAGGKGGLGGGGEGGVRTHSTRT
eukprot:scaffold7653_cov120-Isochrysis_galbana.AAC.9